MTTNTKVSALVSSWHKGIIGAKQGNSRPGNLVYTYPN